MAQADRMTGKDTVVLFIHSGGTANVTGDMRKFSATREQEVADATAGADGARSSKATVKKFGATLEALYTGTAGTAASSFGGLDLGTEGTLLYAPKGTAAGNPKGGFPAIITKCDWDSPYDDMISVKIEWAGQGAELFNPLEAVWS